MGISLIALFAYNSPKTNPSHFGFSRRISTGWIKPLSHVAPFVMYPTIPGGSESAESRSCLSNRFPVVCRRREARAAPDKVVSSSYTGWWIPLEVWSLLRSQGNWLWAFHSDMKFQTQSARLVTYSRLADRYSNQNPPKASTDQFLKTKISWQRKQSSNARLVTFNSQCC